MTAQATLATPSYCGSPPPPFFMPSFYFPAPYNNLSQLEKTEMYVLQLPTGTIRYLLEMQLTNFPGMRNKFMK